MHDLIQENPGRTRIFVFIIFFSGVRLVFGVDMVELRYAGRGDGDEMRGSLPEPGAKDCWELSMLSCPSCHRDS